MWPLASKNKNLATSLAAVAPSKEWGMKSVAEKGPEGKT